MISQLYLVFLFVLACSTFGLGHGRKPVTTTSTDERVRVQSIETITRVQLIPGKIW